MFHSLPPSGELTLHLQLLNPESDVCLQAKKSDDHVISPFFATRCWHSTTRGHWLQVRITKKVLMSVTKKVDHALGDVSARRGRRVEFWLGTRACSVRTCDKSSRQVSWKWNAQFLTLRLVPAFQCRTGCYSMKEFEYTSEPRRIHRNASHR